MASLPASEKSFAHAAASIKTRRRPSGEAPTALLADVALILFKDEIANLGVAFGLFILRTC
jgi:hypothetical protein